MSTHRTGAATWMEGAESRLEGGGEERLNIKKHKFEGRVIGYKI